jgi:hypothetical protein
MHSYFLAGLSIRSEIMLPELVPLSPSDAEPDVEICLGLAPASLPGAKAPFPEAQIADNEVLLNIPKVGRYLVRAGRQVLIDPATHVEPKDLRQFLLGSALGAIYFQRGFFPLHASVVVIQGNAVAFSGDSGAGKSTMAAWMHARGYPLLCDDVCVIRFDEQSGPLAYPGFPRLKLWQDALDAFEVDAGELQRDYFRADKYQVAVSDRFWIDPVPLRHINLLQYSDPGSKPRIEDIKPAHAVHLLRNNTYRYEYISSLGLTESHFLDCVRLARSTAVHYLTRPQDHAAFAECQRLVEEQMA